MPEAENQQLPGATNDSWRAWLTTGVRRGPVDRRRLRGEHRGLKRMLLEGMGERTDQPYTWKEFSGAMVRHAVDEGIRALPDTDRRLIKLAYFGGLTNGEIAREAGMTPATVQRRLRRALAQVSEHVQRGKAFGRRALCGLVLWPCQRWATGAVHHAVYVAAIAVTAASMVAQPAPQPRAQPPAEPRVAAAPRATQDGDSAPPAGMDVPVPSSTSVAVAGDPLPPALATVSAATAPLTLPPVVVPPVKLKPPTL